MSDGLKPESRLAILRMLGANPRVEKVVLFGSRAKGTQRPNSDIDLALFGAELTLDDHAQLASQLAQLPLAQELDLVLVHTIENSDLLDHIRRHGVEWAL